MKIRSILTNAFLASILAISQNFFGSDSNQAKAQSSPRPYVVFVNGWQNCCAWGMNDLQTRLINDMNAEIRYTPYSSFNDRGNSGNTSSDEQFLRDGANFINTQLDRNRPLILVGHSFGGDSVLKLLPRIQRRIQFVAVIDPVRTGGFRSSLINLTVPNNVDYFFNRWQNNEPFPNDFRTDGSIPCNARTCDQDSQNIARNSDFSPLTQECSWVQVDCPGFVAPTLTRRGRKGRQQVRVGHQTLPTDNYIEKIIGDRILSLVAQNSAGATTASSAQSQAYSRFRLQTGTALHQTGDDFAFSVLPNGDLVAIKKSGTNTGKTEVHILSAASNYQEFRLQIGTALHQTGNSFAFDVLPNGDLVAIKKSGTDTGKTEVHILSAASNYQRFRLQTGTALFQTGNSFAFDVLPNGDLVAIKKSGTDTGKTEVHIVSAQ